jgi:cell division protein FtsL
MRGLRVAPAPPRGRTAAFERIRALPDHRLVDGLLRSRAWIVIIAVLLGGIVAMQVSLLKLNSGISRAVEASSTIERQNANMQAQIARLSSSQRVTSAAAKQGMVFPVPGDVGFLRARGERDDQLAVRRMRPPSATAKAVMAASGHDVGTTVATTTPSVDPATAAPTSTTTPVTTTAQPATSTTTSTTAASTTAASTTAPVSPTPAPQG